MAKPKRKRQSGTGGVYKRGRSWVVKWRENGRQRYRTFTDEQVARDVLAKITYDVQRGAGGLETKRAPSPPLGVLAAPWMKRREKTHRAWRDDASRWRVHLKPAFASALPSEIDAARIRRFVEAKLAAGLNPATVGLCVRLLSTMFADLVEQGYAQSNPIRSLPRSTRRLYRSTHDSSSKAFLTSLDLVRRVYQALPQKVAVAFAVGALSGLRTGELLGLDWSAVDLGARRIHVRQQVQDAELGPLKDDEVRTVPIVSALYPVLAAWKLHGASGLLFKPAGRGGRTKRPARYMRPHTLADALKTAFATCELPPMTWYEATRHTYGSLFILAGGRMEHLSKLMGHSSVTVTEKHYCHLRVDLFRTEDYDRFAVDLEARPAVLSLAGGCKLVAGDESATPADVVGS